MRVTNSMLTSSFLSDMQRNLRNMQKLQEQRTSEKLFSKPSDNPSGVVKSMKLYSEISANEQYNSNIDDTINWLDTTDTALKQQGNILQRVRELMVSAGDGTYKSDQFKSIKDEVNELIGQFSQVMNTSFDGKYIFGGTRCTTKPATTIAAGGNTTLVYNSEAGTELTDKTSDEYKNLSAGLRTEISQGVYVEYNVSAKSIMEYGSGAGEDMKTLFSKIVNHLDGKTDDGTATDSTALSKVTGTDLTSMDSAISNLLTIRSEVGAKQNRMETAQTQNTDQNDNLTEILSKNEDVDIAEVTMEYATMKTVYTASLQTASKVLQSSLLDYL